MGNTTSRPGVEYLLHLHFFNYDSFARQRHAWALGVTLDWVIYDSGIRDAQRRQADAQARETRMRTEILRDAIRDDLANQRWRRSTRRQSKVGKADCTDFSFELTLTVQRVAHDQPFHRRTLGNDVAP